MALSLITLLFVTIILDGIQLANSIKEEVSAQISNFRDCRPPKLVVILVGDNTASKLYVKNKCRSSEKVGIKSETIYLENDVSEIDLIDIIKKLNKDSSVDGILLQMPLPQHIDSEKVISHISINKDVDGFNPYNYGVMTKYGGGLKPCTPVGIIAILQNYNIDIAGKHVVILGKSNLVGKPLAILLMHMGATVTVCNSMTPNIKSHTQMADIIVSAVGKKNTVTSDMVHSQSVVIDVGINKIDGKLSGDVDYEQVKPLVKAITPVPGGVGPMTVAMLLVNTVECYTNNTTHDAK